MGLGLGSNDNLGRYLQTPSRVTLYNFAMFDVSHHVWMEERKIKPGPTKTVAKGEYCIAMWPWRSVKTGFRRQSKKKAPMPSTEVEKCTVIEEKK